MNIQHFEKGLQYNDRQLLQIARKVGKLATYCKCVKDESSAIRVEAERRNTKKTRDSMKVTVTVELPGKVLRAESRRPDPVEGVDRCIEKLEPQIKRYKETRMSRQKRSARSRS